MKRLTDIGFRKVGEWQADNGEIKLNIFDLADANNILYAFMFDGQVLYVGKTTQRLKSRMYGYQKPGATQSTNIKGKRLIQELLSNGKKVDIFALPDDGLHKLGMFHLNLAAGLEDSIVKTLKPKWNETGK